MKNPKMTYIINKKFGISVPLPPKKTTNDILFKHTQNPCPAACGGSKIPQMKYMIKKLGIRVPLPPAVRMFSPPPPTAYYLKKLGIRFPLPPAVRKIPKNGGSKNPKVSWPI